MGSAGGDFSCSVEFELPVKRMLSALCDAVKSAFIAASSSRAASPPAPEDSLVCHLRSSTERAARRARSGAASDLSAALLCSSRARMAALSPGVSGFGFVPSRACAILSSALIDSSSEMGSGAPATPASISSFSSVAATRWLNCPASALRASAVRTRNSCILMDKPALASSIALGGVAGAGLRHCNLSGLNRDVACTLRLCTIAAWCASIWSSSSADIGSSPAPALVPLLARSMSACIFISST
mmetsp:Transcript_12130/g.38904  ORF Transcript_12130/g.38904 Transcript_12130/m.38904 type:complete len:243 (+) Transcript_12130:3366-4094(+)